MTNTTLTTKEGQLLNAIAKGMDEPGTGWLHEITPFDNDHMCAGVLGSLVQKGLATSSEENYTGDKNYYVEITEKGEALAS